MLQYVGKEVSRVEIHSVLTIQRDENGVDFEFDVGCTIVQTLNLDTFVYSRKVLFDFFEYADDTDKLTKKRQKKLQTPIECSMVPISFKENKHELETLARVYRPEMGTPDGEDGDSDVSQKPDSPSPSCNLAARGERCLYRMWRVCVCVFIFVCVYVYKYLHANITRRRERRTTTNNSTLKTTMMTSKRDTVRCSTTQQRKILKQNLKLTYLLRKESERDERSIITSLHYSTCEFHKSYERSSTNMWYY